MTAFSHVFIGCSGRVLEIRSLNEHKPVYEENLFVGNSLIQTYSYLAFSCGRNRSPSLQDPLRIVLFTLPLKLVIASFPSHQSLHSTCFVGKCNFSASFQPFPPRIPFKVNWRGSNELSVESKENSLTHSKMQGSSSLIAFRKYPIEPPSFSCSSSGACRLVTYCAHRKYCE